MRVVVTNPVSLLASCAHVMIGETELSLFVDESHTLFFALASSPKRLLVVFTPANSAVAEAAE